MKKIILILVALVTIFAFTGVALAANSATKTWSQGTCDDFFWTSTTSKPATALWNGFYIKATSITYSPSSGTESKLFAKPYSSTGYVMGPQATCYAGSQKTISCTQYESQTYVKFRIENYYGPGGPNMASAGNFYGSYS